MNFRKIIFLKPVSLWLAMITAVFYFSCVPQPIYQSVKKSDDRSKNTSWASVDSVKSGSGNNTQQQSGVSSAAVIPIVAGALSKDKQDAMMIEIRSWIGTPYKFGIVEKGKGTDCSGFVGYVFKRVLNINLPRLSPDMYNIGQPIKQQDMQFGDLVFFENTFKGSKGASHVGIYVGDNRFAHASTTVGVTISELSEDYYSKHFLGCKKILQK